MSQKYTKTLNYGSLNAFYLSSMIFYHVFFFKIYIIAQTAVTWPLYWWDYVMLLYSVFSECFHYFSSLKNICNFLSRVNMNRNWHAFVFVQWFSHYTRLSGLHTGVLDKPGSKFTGIFRLCCNQVPEDAAGFETTQSSVQIWGHAGEK